MGDLIFVVQNCVGVSSPDCRKRMLALLLLLPGDRYPLLSYQPHLQYTLSLTYASPAPAAAR